MQEHLCNAFRKGHDAHRRHRCKLSPMILHAMTAPSRAAKGGDEAAPSPHAHRGARDKERRRRRTGQVPSCKSGLRMAGSGDDGMSGWPLTTTGTTESGLGWRRLGFQRCPSRPISSNGTDGHATRWTEQRADDLEWEPSWNSQSRPASGAMGAASSVDMEESHAGSRGSRAARTTGLHGCRLHGAPPCADRDLGQGTGERWGGSTSCERVPVVWLRRWPPPPVGDDDGGLAGLGFGGARRRRLRRPRVA
jgi:hypothetical protein